MISGLKNALLIAVLALVTTAAPVWAQNAPAPVREFRSFARGSGTTGLPASTVVSLHPAREGRVWIPPFEGLGRVGHGVVERITPSKDAPASGNMFRIIDRRDGGIYVSGNKGLYTWDGTRWSLIATPQEFIGIAENPSRDVVALDRRGQLWFESNGAAEWTRMNGVPEAFEPRAVASATDGRILVAGVGGVLILDGNLVKGLLGSAPAGAPLTPILVTASGRVWCGGEDGRLHSWAEDTGWRSFEIPRWDGGRIRSIAEDRRGLLHLRHRAQ